MFNAFSEYKSKVEGRANVVMLREAETEPVRKGSGRTPAPELQERGNRTPVSSGRNLTTVYFIMCR